MSFTSKLPTDELFNEHPPDQTTTSSSYPTRTTPDSPMRRRRKKSNSSPELNRKLSTSVDSYYLRQQQVSNFSFNPHVPSSNSSSNSQDHLAMTNRRPPSTRWSPTDREAVVGLDLSLSLTDEIENVPTLSSLGFFKRNKQTQAWIFSTAFYRNKQVSEKFLSYNADDKNRILFRTSDDEIKTFSSRQPSSSHFKSSRTLIINYDCLCQEEETATTTMPSGNYLIPAIGLLSNVFPILNIIVYAKRTMEPDVIQSLLGQWPYARLWFIYIKKTHSCRDVYSIVNTLEFVRKSLYMLLIDSCDPSMAGDIYPQAAERYSNHEGSSSPTKSRSPSMKIFAWRNQCFLTTDLLKLLLFIGLSLDETFQDSEFIWKRLSRICHTPPRDTSEMVATQSSSNQVDTNFIYTHVPELKSFKKFDSSYDNWFDLVSTYQDFLRVA